MIPARGSQTNLKNMHGFMRQADKRTCHQLFRAKHLLTTNVFRQSTGNLDTQAIGRWLKYFGLGTVAGAVKGKPDIQTIGRWA